MCSLNASELADECRGFFRNETVPLKCKRAKIEGLQPSGSVLHANGRPYAEAATVDGKAIERLTDQKHDKYPELVASDRVHYVVLACEEGGRWGPDVFAVMNDLVRLKVAPLHPLLRRSAALAYTRRWWSILAMGAQSAAIDCILGRDPQVWVPHGEPPLAAVLADADLAPEPSRIA